jgi:ParB-like chromosome segregation protein Spo0J
MAVQHTIAQKEKKAERMKAAYEPKLMSIDPNLLVRNPWNPNVVNPANEDKLKASMEELGQFKPLIVRETADGLEILGGEHRNDQAVRMGLKSIQVYNLGLIPDDLAKKISLADNAQYGENDFASLAELIKSLDDATHLADIMPISADEIQSMIDHDSLNLDDINLDPDATLDETESLDLPTGVKTHNIVRFKVAIEDQAKLTETIKRIQTEQNFTESDQLTNAGDALIWLISQYRGDEAKEPDDLDFLEETAEDE